LCFFRVLDKQNVFAIPWLCDSSKENLSGKAGTKLYPDQISKSYYSGSGFQEKQPVPFCPGKKLDPNMNISQLSTAAEGFTSTSSNATNHLVSSSPRTTKINPNYESQVTF
jgi:hypothetical protein